MLLVVGFILLARYASTLQSLVQIYLILLVLYLLNFKSIDYIFKIYFFPWNQALRRIEVENILDNLTKVVFNEKNKII